MSNKITISVTQKREHIYNELMKKDTTGIGLSGMLGVAAQYYVEREENICVLPTIDTPPAELKEYVSTCDAEAYKELTKHSIRLHNMLNEENTYRRRL